MQTSQETTHQRIITLAIGIVRLSTLASLSIRPKESPSKWLVDAFEKKLNRRDRSLVYT